MPSEQGHRRDLRQVSYQRTFIAALENTPNRDGGRIRFGEQDIAIPVEALHDVYRELMQVSFDRGRHLSFQRSKHNLTPNTSLVKIEGVDDTKSAKFYLGKKVAFVYRAKREVRGSNIRVIWGKVTRPHGNSGVVRAKFRNNLPPQSLGATVRVMLYPSNI
ncbi:hypothetical protein PDIDSM_1476 [Penicillium digitatum]|nr:hypothetical protein PDIDSM_1476 [Penicillium digitatum]